MILLLMLACNPDSAHSGVLVGNPGEVSLQTAPTDGGTLRTGSVELDTLTLTDCEGASVVVAEGLTIDLLGESRLLLPEGMWCRLSAALAGPLTWTGELSDGTPLTLALEAETLAVESAGFTTADADLILLLDALDLTLLEAEGDDLSVDATHPQHDTLLLSLLEATALYADSDRDGSAEGEEAVAGVGFGADSGVVVSTSSGCGTEEVLTQALLLPLLVGWRRRLSRRTPHTGRS